MPAQNWIPNSAVLKLYWLVGGELVVNVLGAQKPGTVVIGQSLADSLGAAIKAHFVSYLRDRFATTSSLQKVGIRDFSSPGQTEYLDTGAPAVGAGLTEGLPPQVAQCITLRTATASKRGRGRCYLAGWAEAENIANGVMSTVAAQAGIDFLGNVDIALQDAGMDLAVLGRASLATRIVKFTTETDGTVLEEVLSNQAARTPQALEVSVIQSRNSRWETQRRRANGRGGGIGSLTVVASRAT